MKETSDIASIIAAVLCGEASEKELITLEEWKQRSPRHATLYNKIIKEENVREAAMLLHKFDRKEGWRNIYSQLPIEKQTIRRRYLWLNVGKYAAILIMCIGGWMIYHTQEQISTEKIVVSSAVEIIENHGIILKLADGRTINLKDNKGSDKIEDGKVIIKNDNGVLSYRDIQEGDSLYSRYNEIYVARGEVFQLELCDGSRVYLNSMSKIKYPVKFGLTTREIELEGEAYLDVAHNPKHPFIVKTKDFNVKVLGTKFNLSAYSEDCQINTTLIEGVVEVESPKFHVSTKLKPNEQFNFNKITLEQSTKIVDVNHAIAWTEGKIRFRDIQLIDLMNILKRWYDIEVAYDDPETQRLIFGCNFNRTDSIDQLLEIFEQTKKITVSRSGKYLHIRLPR